MQMLDIDWLCYQTRSAITGMRGSILVVTIPPGTSQEKKYHPSGLRVGDFSSIFFQQ